jgi:hypothetical protein
MIVLIVCFAIGLFWGYVRRTPSQRGIPRLENPPPPPGSNEQQKEEWKRFSGEQNLIHQFKDKH